MKKSVLSKLTVIAVVFAMAGGVVFGATEATLLIEGAVTPITWVKINNLDAATLDSLDFSVVGEETVPTTYYSNDTDGFIIKINSANDGVLVSGNTTETIAYTVTYGDLNAVTLTTADQTAKTVSYTGSTVAADLVIAWAAQPDKPAETYSDTISITITNQ